MLRGFSRIAAAMTATDDTKFCYCLRFYPDDSSNALLSSWSRFSSTRQIRWVLVVV